MTTIVLIASQTGDTALSVLFVMLASVTTIVAAVAVGMGPDRPRQRVVPRSPQLALPARQVKPDSIPFKLTLIRGDSD